MPTRALTSVAITFIACASGAAVAQDQVVASLPYAGGLTGGPVGTTYQPPDEARTIWILEDFGISSATALTTFQSIGTVFPGPNQVIDVYVRIYDALPPDGHLLMSSIPGTGHVVPVGPDAGFTADFGGQLLPAGSYWVAWSIATYTASGGHRAILWVQGGPHTVGAGLPDNAWKWNPGGAWGYPNNIRPVPADLEGNGQTGVNFILRGRPVCYANCDNSTVAPILNVADFVCFQQHFAAGDSYANCDNSTTPPTLNIADFLCFMSSFATGCP